MANQLNKHIGALTIYWIITAACVWTSLANTGFEKPQFIHIQFIVITQISRRDLLMFTFIQVSISFQTKDKINSMWSQQQKSSRKHSRNGCMRIGRITKVESVFLNWRHPFVSLSFLYVRQFNVHYLPYSLWCWLHKNIKYDCIRRYVTKFRCAES